MSDLLSSLVLGDARQSGRRRGGAFGLVEGLLEAGEILFGHVLGEPRWRGFDAISMVVGDERRRFGVPVLMGLADRPPGPILATLLDLRRGEAVLVPGRMASPGPGLAEATVADAFVAAEVSSARVEAARIKGDAVGLGDAALDRSREAAYRATAARNVGLAEGAEREMLGLFRDDRRQGMSVTEAFAASVGQYRSAHPDASRGVMLLAARLLRADVGLPADAPEARAFESSLRAPPARSLAVGGREREEDGWERKPWR